VLEEELDTNLHEEISPEKLDDVLDTLEKTPEKKP
jgi:hypothetical protein